MFSPQRFGRYLLVKRISTGGMAEVFLARAPSQPGSQQLVAIKRILPWANEETEFTNMFIDEACISASLKHPNVARVLEFGQEKDHYFLAMEYVSGRDLRSVLTYLQRTKTRPPVALVMVVGMRLAQALDYAHRRKRPDGTPMEIIHRDVSPPNVLLTFDGGVKLIDFGIAKASSRATRTRAGRLKGKIAYMSPEQVQGKDIDQRADLFSLGVLLYELITGESLFHGKNQIDTMHQVRRADVPAPSSRNPEVSKEVEVILYKALAKDRNERFQTAAKLREEIQRYLVRSRAVFGPEHLMRWMHEHFEGALQEERRTLRQARSLSIDDYPEDGAEDDDPTPVTSVPHEAAQAEPAYSGGGEMQMDLKATMLDGAPPAMMMEEQIYAAERDLDVTPKDGVKPKMPPMPRQKVRADTTPRMPPRAARPAAPAPASGAGPALDDAVTPRDGLAPADHRGDDTPVRKMPSAPFRPRSAAAVSLSSSFDDSWTPAEGIHTGPPPPPPVDPDDAPTELAIPTFPVQADLSDTVDTGGMIPPTSQPLVEDATMVDRPLFDHAHTPSSSPIAPGDNRDRAVAGGELEIPRTDGPRGPRVEPIAPGSNRDRAAVGGSVSVPSQPAMHIPEMEDISRVSVEGIDDGQATGYFRRQDPGPAPVQPAQGKGQESTWSQVVTEKRRRFSSTQIIVFAASLTLIVVGIIAVLTLLPGKKGRSSGGVEGGGSLVVTTKPPAACTISLDKAAKGLLSPGAAVSLADIKEGGHRIAVTCVGFIPFAADVKVARGEVTVLEAKLVKDKK